MNRFLLTACILIAGVLLVAPIAATQTTHQVTFIVNTATVPDTIMATSPVVITGGSSNDTAANSLLTNWTSGIALTNIGGDYWSVTKTFNDTANLAYKIRIGGSGWEENVGTGSTNRELRVTADTTLMIQFWNNGHLPAGKNPPPYSLPYDVAPDSMLTVYVRVNIKGVSDNQLYGWTAPDADSVCILGGGPTGSNLDWGTPLYLTKESAPTNSAGAFGIPPTSFYHGALRIPKSQVTAGQDVPYKFRLGSNWNYGATQRAEQLSGPSYGGGNRHFVIPQDLKDTTLQWVYFGDTKPTGRANLDTVIVTWRVDVTTARNKGSFNIGDSLQVQSGFFGTADSTRTRLLTRQGLTNIYGGKDTVITSLGKPLDYQYYLHKNGADIREYFFNFQYAGDITSEAERRQYSPASTNVTVYDSVVSVTAARRQPYFENQRLLTRSVHVTWTVDVRPAYYQVMAGDTLHDIQGSGAEVVNVDSIRVWGVAINGPATGGPNGPLPVDWATWDSHMVADTSKRKMYDDGTHGDVTPGDSIYSVQFMYTTSNTVGKIFKFGIRGGDNESSFGLNHLENLSDADSVFTVQAQWGSINPNFYDHWDYDLHQPRNPTGVTQVSTAPVQYALQQNYPNPFNPTTKIQFSLAKQSNVELKVFNILGQEVATLVNGVLGAGTHITAFDGKSLASGLYFYRLTAGNFTSVKKMMLVK